MGHGAPTGETRSAYKILVGSPKRRDHSKNLGIEGKIILKWMLGKEGGKMRTGYMWLRIETIGGLL